MLIETNFDKKKVPWNFLQSSMELFEQHFNKPAVPWNSMEFKQQNLKLPVTRSFDVFFLSAS